MRQLGCAPNTPETGPMVFTVRFNHTPSASLGLTAIDATLDVAYYLLGKRSGSWSSAAPSYVRASLTIETDG